MRPRRAGLALFPAALLALAASGPARESIGPERHVFLWEVSDPEHRAGTLYLMGSTHAGLEPHVAMDPVIERAFARADVLAVEVDTRHASPRAQAATARELGVAGPGASFAERVSARIYRSARSALRAQGLRPEALDAYEPWLVSLVLAGNALARHGYDPQYGVDEYFLRRAGARRVVELEGARRQLSALDSMSPELQVLMLEETLGDLAELGAIAAAITEHWRSGDARGLGALLLGGPQARARKWELHERIYYARSRAMAHRLQNPLRENEVWFAVVGAGHMVGPQGLPALFERGGYRVRQLRASSRFPRPRES